MRQIYKILITLCVLTAFCVSMYGPAFAGTADEQGGSFLEDIFGFMVDLETEEEIPLQEDTVLPYAEDLLPYVRSLHEVYFVVPEEMQLYEEGSDSLVFVNDFNAPTKVITAEYIDTKGESINLKSEADQKRLMKEIAGVDAEDVSYGITYICLHETLDAIFTKVDNGITVECRILFVDLGDALFVVSFIAREPESIEMIEFYNFRESIYIGDETLEEDHSLEPAPEQESVLSSNSDVPESPMSPIPADAIDATQVDEVVLVDDELCKVSMKDFKETRSSLDNSISFFEIPVHLENKSEKTLGFKIEYIALDDYLPTDPFFSHYVDPYQQADTGIALSSTGDLRWNHTTDIREISFRLRVWDKEDFTEYISEYFNVLPFGPDVPAQPAQEFSADAIVLVDNELFTLIITGAPFADYVNPLIIPIYFENHSDKTVTLDEGYVLSINGTDIFTYITTNTLPPGKKTNTDMYWNSIDLEERSVDKIEYLDWDVIVRDEDAERNTDQSILYEEMLHIDFD